MPEINQYAISHRELLELLIKQSGFTEGKWTLMANFGITAASFGPDPSQSAPGVAIALQKVGLQRAAPGTPEEMTMDASEVNPPKQTRRTTRRRKKS